MLFKITLIFSEILGMKILSTPKIENSKFSIKYGFQGLKASSSTNNLHKCFDFQSPKAKLK